MPRASHFLPPKFTPDECHSAPKTTSVSAFGAVGAFLSDPRMPGQATVRIAVARYARSEAGRHREWASALTTSAPGTAILKAWSQLRHRLSQSRVTSQPNSSADLPRE